MSSMRHHGGSGGGSGRILTLDSRRILSAESDISSGSSEGESESENMSDTSGQRAVENKQRRGNQAAASMTTNTPAATVKRRGRTHSSDLKVRTDTAAKTATASTSSPSVAQVTPYEMKKAVEKKFRTRYRTLQEAYENRLHALALQVQHTVAQIQNDTTVFCLQENPLTSEFASIRLGEIVQECFFGEREKYIKVVSDQVAWQASDLREVQRKLRVMQQREKDVQQKWKQSQREVQSLQRQLDIRVDELHGQKRLAVQQEEKFQGLREEKDALQLEVDKLKLGVHSFEALQKEYEALQVRNQNESEKEQAAQEKFRRFAKEIEALKAVNVRLEMEKHASEQEIAHVQHLLSLSEAKNRDLSDTLRYQQSKDYPSKIARLEAELLHLNQASAALQQENEELKKKYQEFGFQVEVFMKEQSEEKASVLKKGEDQVKQVQAQLDAARQQGQDALKAKQLDLVRLADQLKFRQEALAKAEQKVQVLEERVNVVEAQVADEKLRSANQVGELEKEIAHWRNQVSKEKEKVQAGEKSLVDTKEKYEAKMSLLQESFEKKILQSVKEREAEARTRWQNDFVAKQEARIEALKAKYDAALENQQSELLRARQQALDSAAAIYAKYETSKRSHREEEELEQRRRADAVVRERAVKDDERAREVAHKRMQAEFEEREKRLLERERLLVEKERTEERKRAERAQRNTASAAATATPPSVVVVNMQSADDPNDQQEQKGNGGNGGKVVSVVNKSAARRVQPREKTHFEDRGESILKAHHVAELQAREAQVMLQSEERLQKALAELQTRKEKEFRAAMVNVRKGIQKLEAAVEDARKEKKRLEQEVLSERQAFVALKQESDEMKEAKQTVVQRLEEANDNIGKLRSVVKESGKKCQRLEEQIMAVQESEGKSVIAASDAQRTIAILREELNSLSTVKEQREAELKAWFDSQEQLQKQIRRLERELQRCKDELQAEKSAAQERNREEVSTASSQYDLQLKQVEIREAETRSLLDTAEGKINRLEVEIRELKQEKASFEASLQQMKVDRSQQRKDFNNLTRIHKNLAETIDKRVNEEIAERQKVESLLNNAEKEINNIKLHKQRVLLVYKMHLSKLKKDMLEMRKAVKTEMKMAMHHLERDFIVVGGSFEKQAAIELQDKIAKCQRQLESERVEWKQLLQQKEQEISGLFGHQRVDNQSKYDQITQQLEVKTQELNDVEAQLANEKNVNSSLQLVLQKMENDSERSRMEQSRLQEQLSGSKISSEREAEEKQQSRTMLERRMRLCHVLHSFVMSMIKAHNLNPPGILLREGDASWQEKWDEQQLKAELDHVAELLYENSQQAIIRAREEGTESVLNELDAAKNALHALWSKASAGDDVYQHLPWYVAANRAVKQLQDDAEREYTALKLEVSAKEAQIQDLRQRKVQLQEANNVLRFEKETIVREMNLFSQTSTKKRDQDVGELRLDFERKLEQAKHMYGTEKMKADQEYQITIDQLRDALEAERRSYSSLKSQSMTYQMEMEKVHEELKDKIVRLEKEGDEIRDAVRFVVFSVIWSGEMEAKGEACCDIDDVEHRRKHADSCAFPDVRIVSRHGERLEHVVPNDLPASSDATHTADSTNSTNSAHAHASHAANATAPVIGDRGSVKSYGGVTAQYA